MKLKNALLVASVASMLIVSCGDDEPAAKPGTTAKTATSVAGGSSTTAASGGSSTTAGKSETTVASGGSSTTAGKSETTAASGGSSTTAGKSETTAASGGSSTTAASGGSSTTAASGGATTVAGGTAAGGTVDCKPVKPGVLSVVTSLPGPNFWGSGEEDPDMIKSGVEYDMAVKIAEKCGLKMEFRNESWDALMAAQLDPKTYDIVISQITITDDRKTKMDFSVPYFQADQSLLIAEGTPVPATWADVQKMTIGVQAETTAEQYVKGDKPIWDLPNLKSFKDLSEVYTALTAGRVQGVIIDTPINLGQAGLSGGKLKVVAQFKTGDQLGAVFPKGSGREKTFDPIIKELVDAGVIKDLSIKYFKGDPTAVPFMDVPAK